MPHQHNGPSHNDKRDVTRKHNDAAIDGHQNKTRNKHATVIKPKHNTPSQQISTNPQLNETRHKHATTTQHPLQKTRRHNKSRKNTPQRKAPETIYI
mgnify:FL=1